MRVLILMVAVLGAMTSSVEAGRSLSHRRAAPVARAVVVAPPSAPRSGFDVPSTAGTSLLGAPLVGGGRLSGRID